MKKISKNIILAVVAGILLIFTGILTLSVREKTEGIESFSAGNDARYQCAAYDEENAILYLGTHDNSLYSFSIQGELLWEMGANGSYCGVIYHQEEGILIAGNADGNVYIYDASTGDLLQTINIQRRIVAIDTNVDASRIALATITGLKSNLLIINRDGEVLSNQQFNVHQTGVCFAENEEDIIATNVRGEVKRYTADGEEIKSYSTNYEIRQMIKNANHYWVVCKNGGYFGFDSELNCIRSGKINNDVQAKIKSIGIDSKEECVIVGSEEGYIFIADGTDKQIYSENMVNYVSAFQAVGDTIYMVGYGGMVDAIHVENLKNLVFYSSLYEILKICLLCLAVFFCIGVIIAVPVLRRNARRLLREMWKHRIAYIMLLPTFALIILYKYRAIVTSFIRAFTNWSITNNTAAEIEFVGFDNFVRMVTEGYFLVGIKNLLILLVTGVLKNLTTPLLCAWLVFSLRNQKQKYLYRFLLVLPIVVPGVVSALTWQKIYDPNIGLLNQILGALGLEQLQRVWLGDANLAIWAIVFIGFPFVGAMSFLVYYGGFINIGEDVLESARIDGATKGNVFWKIQLPIIKPQINLVIMLSLISGIQDFNNILIMTGGGPGTSTYVPALELFMNVSQFGRYGYACALGVVLFLVTVVITMLSKQLGREYD